MRTLSRPMFNMGGPIKQGIMQGIREPYRGGGAALVGNPVYPQTGGREHHNVVLKEGIKRAGPIFQRVGNIFKGAPSKVTPKYPQTYTGKEYIPAPLTKMEQIKNWFGSAPAGKYLSGTPEAGIIKGLYEGKGMITKPIKWTATQAVKSPIIMGGLVWTGVNWVRKDGSPASTDEIEQNTAQHGPFDHTDKKKIAKAQAAFAEAQRDTRVKKYLDMMGYDRSKKTAVADALIDASKIVSDRGTLETKNITRDLISPIIQATSKRFDKPEQIREAVGLMSVKAAIQKDLEDPQVAKLRALQIESEQKKLSPGVGARIMAYMASKKDDVKGDELVDLVRLSTTDEGKKFKYITDEEVALIPELKGKTALEIVSSTAKEDGVYMVGNSVIEVEGGIPTQIK